MGSAPRESTSMSDGELIEASVREPDYFTVLYERRAEELAAYFLKRVGDPHVAADLLAESIAVAFSKRRKYSAQKGKGQAWLYGIARIELAEYRRKKSVELRMANKIGLRAPVFTDDDIARLEALVDAQLRAAEIEAGLDMLTEETRDAVVGRVVDGKGYDELAVDAGTTPGAIRVRVHRGLSRLAGELGR